MSKIINGKDTVILKRCPLCGQRAYIDTSPMMPIEKEYFPNSDGIFYSIVCSNCLLETRGFVKKEEAIKLWNERINYDKL